MYIDILCMAAAAYGFFLGFKEGIVNTVFRTISIVIALMAAFRFSPYVTEMIEKGFEVDSPLMFIVGYVVTFFLVMWMLRFIGSLLTQGMEIVHFNLPNQVIGGTVLAFIFVVFFSIVLWFADGAKMVRPETKTESITYYYLQPLPDKTFSFLSGMKPSFQKFFSQTGKMMDKVERNKMNNIETKSDIYNVPNKSVPVVPQQTVNPYDNTYQPEKEQY